MAASEAVPFAKSGGLADMVPALSRALIQEGHQVTILLPRYGFIPLDEDRQEITLGEDSFVEIQDRGIKYLFWNSPYFALREALYGEDGVDYPDNALAFAQFSRGVLRYCRHMGNIEVLHLHDWMTGLIPFFLKTEFSDLTLGTVFTIHNIGYQGWFSRDKMGEIGIKEGDAYYLDLMKDDQLNYLQAGLYNSDYLTTVSPTYAEEICFSAYNFGLGKVIRSRNHRLTGILNGIDMEDWNPGGDPYLPEVYSRDNLEGKGLTKAALQREVGLEENPEVPLFGFIGRLVHQKGVEPMVDKDASSLRVFLTTYPKAQFILLGSGDPSWEQALRKMGETLPNLAVITDFNNQLAHRIEGGCDFFFMPSLYEPCGLNQMYSMRYGTLPVVRETGGLADTVTDLRVDKKGTGFVFEGYSAEDQVNILTQVYDYWYQEPDRINWARLAGMDRDFSWNTSAKEYIRVYKKAGSR